MGPFHWSPIQRKPSLKDPEETRDIPPQLLFLHMVFNLFICRLYFQGLEGPKGKLHWHPQIQNVIVNNCFWMAFISSSLQTFKINHEGCVFILSLLKLVLKLVSEPGCFR